ALGAFLIAGVARIVVLQHCTFLINSACHTIGRQPYSTRCSARDSFFLALFTMGEGYHNYHHEFQHDYRNGVKPWQFDPTKWIIWTLAKVGLAWKLRRVPTEKILLSELSEAQHRLATKLSDPGLTELAVIYITNACQHLETVAQQWTMRRSQQMEVTRERLADLRREIRAATSVLRLPGMYHSQPA